MFVLDTDHISLYQQGHHSLGERLRSLPENQLCTTIVTYEEQVGGRLAVVHRATKPAERVQSFYWLQQTLKFFCRIPVLPFDDHASAVFERLVALKLRVGTQDLQIASIVLARNDILLTRNRRDFQRIPDLMIEDWSIPSSSKHN